MRKRRFFDPRLVPERRRSTILACMLFWSALSYVAISRYVVGSAEVVGDSMLPSLQNGDRCILNRFTYRWHGPRRGDVVAVQLPGDDSISVKRVVALPHELIAIKENGVFVNRRRLAEPYLEPDARTFAGPLAGGVYQIAPDCYFLLGDNREWSLDSRFVGAVHRDAILGRVVLPAE